MMMDMIIFSAADEGVRGMLEKLEALEYKGIKHASYLAFAKTLIQEECHRDSDDGSASFFRYKFIKVNLLAALADNPQEFPELRRDLTNTSLYYLLSLKESGFGRNQQSKSLLEFRAIQEASKVKNLSEVAALANTQQSVWNDYEFTLRYERAAAGDKAEHRACYQQALLRVLKYMETAKQKLRFFIKAYDADVVDEAFYQAARGEVKKVFRSREMNNNEFNSAAEKLLADHRHRELIELIAAADRRDFFKKYLANNALLLDGVSDAQKALFSQNKLRPLLNEANGEAKQKRSFFGGGAASLFSFVGGRVASQGDVQMSLVKPKAKKPG